jgi:raffinose/stachyose/melibiose transport system substrate-binding protein
LEEKMKLGRFTSVAITVFALASFGLLPRSGAEAARSNHPAGSAAQAGKVTLTVWDNEADGKATVEQQLYAAFHKKYPNVTVNRVAFAFNDLVAKLPLAMSGPNPPDVTELAGAGGNTGTVLVKGGLLVNLDSYAKKYGWTKRFSKSFLSWGKFTTAGQHGYGHLYGLAQSGELVGVYYNKSLLKSLKIAVPKTLAEFEKALATVKEHGKTPILLGDLEKWPASHDYASLDIQLAGASFIRHFYYADKHVSYNTSQNLQAATTFQSWAKKGYFEDGFLGVSYNDMVPKFSSGDYAFLITGSWLDPDLEKAMGTNVGFMLVPPVKAGNYGGEGATSEPYAISSKSKNKAIAAQFIDFITNKAAELALLKSGDLPGMGGLAKNLPSNTAQAGLVHAWGQVAKANGLAPYFDGATPTLSDTLYSGLQELLGGQISPQQFVSQIQDNYGQVHP